MAQIIEFQGRYPAAGANRVGHEESGQHAVVELSEEDSFKAPFKRIFSRMGRMTLLRNGERILPLKHFLHYLKEIASFFPEDTMTVSELVNLNGMDFSNAEKGVNIWAMMEYGIAEGRDGINDPTFINKRRLMRLIREMYGTCVEDLMGLDVRHYEQYVDFNVSRGGAQAVVMATIMEETFVDYKEFLQGFSDFLVSAESTLEPVKFASALKSVVNERVEMCLNG